MCDYPSVVQAPTPYIQLFWLDQHSVTLTLMHSHMETVGMSLNFSSKCCDVWKMNGMKAMCSDHSLYIMPTCPLITIYRMRSLLFLLAFFCVHDRWYSFTVKIVFQLFFHWALQTKKKYCKMTADQNWMSCQSVYVTHFYTSRLIHNKAVWALNSLDETFNIVFFSGVIWTKKKNPHCMISFFKTTGITQIFISIIN